jgi:hypothetical protein
MASTRQATEAFILKWIGRMLPGGKNVKIYKDLFASWSDKDFEAFMTSIETGEEMLAIIAPNLDEEMVTVPNNLAVAEELGHNFYESIWVNEGNGEAPYLTPKKYLVTLQPFRRQAQLLVKKISIPEDNRSINDLTGQPSSSGSSRGSKISYPETQIMAALNLDNSLIEMLKYRGGDQKGFVAMNKSISQTGGVSLDALSKLNTRVKSTDTLRTLLTCMHFEVDL